MAATAFTTGLGYLLLGGMVLGSGIAGYNNADNACQSVQNAVETLKEAKKAKDKWVDVISSEKGIDQQIINDITEHYTQIALRQKKIQEAQSNSKKTKTIIIGLGLAFIFILFFFLLYRYFYTRIRHITSTTKASSLKMK